MIAILKPIVKVIREQLKADMHSITKYYIIEASCIQYPMCIKCDKKAAFMLCAEKIIQYILSLYILFRGNININTGIWKCRNACFLLCKSLLYKIPFMVSMLSNLVIRAT